MLKEVWVLLNVEEVEGLKVGIPWQGVDVQVELASQRSLDWRGMLGSEKGGGGMERTLIQCLR